MNNNPLRLNLSTALPYLGYIVMLLLFSLGYFFPEARLWGINFTAYLSTWPLVVLSFLALLAPFICYNFTRSVSGNNELNDRFFSRLTLTLTVIILGVGFFLRPVTYFLGDGYTLLTTLASDDPIIKIRELGETYAHYGLMKLIPTDPDTAALLSFQIISFVSGFLFLIALTYFTRRIFSDTVSRVIFWLGVASGGYTLLFFGYVEHYSLLCLTVSIFILLGIYIAKGNSNKWFIIIPAVMAVFFHSIGAALIPGAIYLLISKGQSGTIFPRLSKTVKLSLLAIAIGLAVGSFIYLFQTNFFFRLAFVPLFPTEITPEGYTLLSLNHIYDMINQILLLLPGLLVLITAIIFRDKKAFIINRADRFLAISMLSCLTVVFIIEPRLGMPRDWDLFAFAGIPIVISWFYYLLTKVKDKTARIRIGTLAITLGVISLLGRTLVLADTDSGITQMKSYISLDKIKNRNGQAILVIYYQSIKDAAMANVEETRRHELYPQIRLVDSSKVLIESGRYDLAFPILQKVLEVDPLYWNAWVNLGAYYLHQKQFDSAQITSNIAMGLNPFNLEAMSQTAYAHYYLDQYDQAENIWKKVLSTDSNHIGSLAGMANISYAKKNEVDYFKYLNRAASNPTAPAVVIGQLGYYYVSKKEYRKAASVLRLAIEKGLDTSKVTRLFKTHPQLANEMPELAN